MNVTLGRLEKSLRESVVDLSCEQTQAHPPSKWTIQEIVEHLTLTYIATAEVLSKRITKGKPTEAKPSALQYCAQWTVLTLGYFPKGRSAPAAVMPFTPSTPLSGEDLMQRATERLQAVNVLLDQASLLFGDKRRSVSHIVLGPLTPTQWRRFHLVHGLHHIRQIEALRLATVATRHRRLEDPLRR